MKTSRRIFLGAVAWTAVISAAHATLNVDWKRMRNSLHPLGRLETLTVGGLPVTCNLTLPIACMARRLDKSSGKTKGAGFEYSKYNGWPEIKESLLSGRIQAAYMLAPLVMDLADKNIPVKVVSLGHRSGAVIMVRVDSGYRSFKELAGKRVAIPNRFAVDYLFLRKMLAREGMTDKDLVVVEMAPPDMPAALYVNAVDAYCTGEPFGAAAQRAGYATPLRLTRNEWPNYICCVLTVREELIRENRLLVQELVNYVQGAGAWLDATPENRMKASDIASRSEFFNQDKAIIRYVMENPRDRVTYADLTMIRAEFEELMALSLEAGTLKRAISFERYADDTFVKAATCQAISI
jgi:NitT/TauT family transport system substrate-binding protein